MRDPPIGPASIKVIKTVQVEEKIDGQTQSLTDEKINTKAILAKFFKNRQINYFIKAASIT